MEWKRKEKAEANKKNSDRKSKKNRKTVSVGDSKMDRGPTTVYVLCVEWTLRPTKKNQ